MESLQLRYTINGDATGSSSKCKRISHELLFIRDLDSLSEVSSQRQTAGSYLRCLATAAGPVFTFKCRPARMPR